MAKRIRPKSYRITDATDEALVDFIEFLASVDGVRPSLNHAFQLAVLRGIKEIRAEKQRTQGASS